MQLELETTIIGFIVENSPQYHVAPFDNDLTLYIAKDKKINETIVEELKQTGI